MRIPLCIPTWQLQCKTIRPGSQGTFLTYSMTPALSFILLELQSPLLVCELLFDPHDDIAVKKHWGHSICKELSGSPQSHIASNGKKKGWNLGFWTVSPVLLPLHNYRACAFIWFIWLRSSLGGWEHRLLGLGLPIVLVYLGLKVSLGIRLIVLKWGNLDKQGQIGHYSWLKFYAVVVNCGCRIESPGSLKNTDT